MGEEIVVMFQEGFPKLGCTEALFRSNFKLYQNPAVRKHFTDYGYDVRPFPS